MSAVGRRPDATLAVRAPCGCPAAALASSGSFFAEPNPRALLGPGTILRTQGRQGLVERGVTLAGGFRNNVPFHRLDLVHRCALSAQQYTSEAVLCDRTVLFGGLAQQRHRGGLVLRRAGTVIERDGVFDLGVDVVGERRRLQQPHRLVEIFRNAGALLVEGRQRVLRFRIAGVGGDAKQFRGALEVLRQRLPVEIEQRQIIRRLRIAELGRGRQQFHGFLAIDRAAAPAEPKHRQREHALTIAAVGGALVPVGGLGIVPLDTHRVGVQFAEHGHRLWIAEVLRAFARKIERRLVLPALIGAIHQIGVGILWRGGGSYRRDRCCDRWRGLCRRGGSRRLLGYRRWFCFRLGGRFVCCRRRVGGAGRRQRDLRRRVRRQHQTAYEDRYRTQDFHFRRYPCSAL